MDQNLPSRILDVRALHEAASDPDALEQEFASIPKNAATMNDIPPSAKPKCRYVNVLPNPETRVFLEEQPGEPDSTFINANYLSGYDGQPRFFIATQGPLPNTINDFWRMVFQERVECIVMITGLFESSRRKCERYWPDQEGMTQEYGDIEVQTEEAIDCGEHIQTTMFVKNRKKPEEPTRVVKHFWFTGWPDHGAPENTWPILELLKVVREATAQSMAPMVVHCSAGIGRTGTFMALHIGVQELQNEWRVVDVLRTVSLLRRQRGGTVQTPVQYEFIYRALSDYATPGMPHSMFGQERPRTVTLQKQPGEAFGFTIRGSCVPFFFRIEEGSLAARQGCRIGDHILAINGVDQRNTSHNEVVSTIRTCGDTVTFQLLSKTPF